MMIVVVSEHVAAGPQRSPSNPCLLQLINDRRCLLFRVRCDDPINRAAHTQTRQLRETLSALCAHSESRRDLFECSIPFFQLVRFFIHFSAVDADDADSRIKNNSWSLTRLTVPAPSVKTKSPGCTCSRNVAAALSSGPM